MHGESVGTHFCAYVRLCAVSVWIDLFPDEVNELNCKILQWSFSSPFYASGLYLRASLSLLRPSVCLFLSLLFLALAFSRKIDVIKDSFTTKVRELMKTSI